MNKSSKISKAAFVLVALLVLNFISSKLYFRFDLTDDSRYTLSQPAVDIIESVTKRITINVFLEGEFPSEFKRLQDEAKQLLEEINVKNSKIRFKFLDPLDGDPEKLIQLGLQPSQLSVQQNGRISEIVIFPWAVVQRGKKIEKVSLLKDTNAQSQDEQLQNAIQNLEYAFTDAIHKIVSKKEKKIAVIKGNGELDDIYIADFLRTIGEYYHLAPFTLDSVATNPNKTLQQLTGFDLAIIAKPTERFTENEKYTLDQFITNGGKTLWLVDQVHAELDSLMDTGESLAYPRDLNLTDLLFSYGVRVNPLLVQDMYSSKIPLATGNLGNNTQYNEFLWDFHPISQSTNSHPINKHIEPISFKFTSNIDLLKSDIKKTILLQSSPLSKTIGTPTIINLNSIAKQGRPEDYNDGNQPLAVLLEGDFKSAYKSRIKPFKSSLHKNESITNKMIVIADGDIVKNQITRGQPELLGIDKFTGQHFGNKEFLLNCINYLLDDSGLIQVRSKTINIKTLNREKSYQERYYYQILNVILPIIILGIFSILFIYIRKRKYQ